MAAASKDSQADKQGDEEKAVRAKRADYDVQSPVDPPVVKSPAPTVINVTAKDNEQITVTTDGPVAVVSIGGKSVKLDSEAVTEAARVFKTLSAGGL